MSRIGQSAGDLAAYFTRNPSLGIGLLLVGGLALFSIIGGLFIDPDRVHPLSAGVAKPPSADLPFGSDTAGRDLLAVMVFGTLLTMKIGLLAGAIGIALGTILAFVAAYNGGWVDAVITLIIDVFLTVPGLMVLIVLASAIPTEITTTMMALVVASLAWREPARQIRAQVLVMRESTYVAMARLSGSSGAAIIFRELMPNLLPYLGASFVSAVAAAVLASIGLEALGMGGGSEPTLGMSIFWMMREGALLRGIWWWVLEPVAILTVLFVGLYFVTAGLDELANPRLRRRA